MMKRFLFRHLLTLILVGGTGLFLFVPGYVERGQNSVIACDPWPVSHAARAMHVLLTISDWHADPLLWGRDLTQRSTRGHTDLPRLIEGNVALQVFTTVPKSPSDLNYDDNSTKARDDITLLSIAQLRPSRSWFDLTERALALAAALARAEARAPDTLKIIRGKADLDAVLQTRAEGGHIVGGLLGAEGGHALSGELANLNRLYEAGFRLIGLTHFVDNELGASLHGEAGADSGLTDFDRAVVERMVERKMIIDLAHASPAVAREVLAMFEVPLVVSYTGIHAVCPSVCNFPDDLMQAISA